MKKLLLTLITWGAVLTVGATDYTYPYLVLTTTSGAETALDVSDLAIVFSGDNLVATNAAGTQTFALTTLATMHFSETVGTAVAVKSIEGNEADSCVDIYNTAGLRIGQYENLAAARQQLRRGIYVAKAANGQTLKISIQ